MFVLTRKRRKRKKLEGIVFDDGTINHSQRNVIAQQMNTNSFYLGPLKIPSSRTDASSGHALAPLGYKRVILSLFNSGVYPPKSTVHERKDFYC